MHHFADKGPYRQSYGFFPVVMYGCESWTIKVEHQRIYVFELWCWGRFLRILWKARRANQSILKETNPEYWKNWYWSWSSKTLANWCKELTHWKKKTLILGKIEGRRRRGQQRMRWLVGITDSMGMSLSRHRQIMKDREAWCAAVHEVTKSQTWLTDWTRTTLRQTVLFSLQFPYRRPSNVGYKSYYHLTSKSIPSLCSPHLAEFSTMKNKEFPQIGLKSHLEVLFVKNYLMELWNPGFFKDS